MPIHETSLPIEPTSSETSVDNTVRQHEQGAVVPEGNATLDLTYRSFKLFLEIFKKLGLLDKLLSPLIIVVMIVGVVIGEFVPNVQEAFDTVRFDTVSVRKSHVPFLRGVD